MKTAPGYALLIAAVSAAAYAAVKLAQPLLALLPTELPW